MDGFWAFMICLFCTPAGWVGLVLLWFIILTIKA